MRLFIAVEIKQIPTILSLINSIKQTNADVKLVDPENIHLTLAFLGEVEDLKLSRIEDSMNSVKFSKFNIVLRGTGAFPSISRPRVVWIGIEKGFNNMKDIRAQLVSNLKLNGIKPEDDKEFVPHITIGRVKGPRNLSELSSFIIKNANELYGEMEVNEIKLFKSTLTPKGPIYEVLYAIRANN
ncbi:RNA 2',3'-cyclic phosphodiesterase [Acidianus brierleyi]|uniref:RNA 2',3'-cyclic phosphodiesterase n=1 Tax=Acidianus brierleyi TaxID=41673 RepID=A0A2U9IGJ9_9CREN|nr:RNA 2',3'-cyclic phosphodiesterase [Acidianus brierleyi]AWR95085.1 RNA 2',3'-cyclic phosphodiesterase [Acidianus brierleyi]